MKFFLVIAVVFSTLQAFGSLKVVRFPEACESRLDLDNTPDIGVLSMKYLSEKGALNLEKWNALKQAVENLNLESQTKGDVADHKLQVGMIVSNKDRPQLVEGEAAQRIFHIISQSRLLKLIAKVMRADERLLVRRMQFNRMRGGDYNLVHRDNADDANYIYTVVFYLTPPHKYSGAELFFEHSSVVLKPELFSIIVFKSHLSHGVMPLDGVSIPRDAIVALLGKDLGPRIPNH